MSQDVISSKILRAMRDAQSAAKDLLDLRTYRDADRARIYALEHDGAAEPVRLAVWDSRRRQLWVAPIPDRGAVGPQSSPDERLSNMFAGDLQRLTELAHYYGRPIELEGVPADRRPWQLPAHVTRTPASIENAAHGH